MEKNAEMVITKHRALFGKPGEMKQLVKLPVKRARGAPVQTSQVIVAGDQVRDIVCLLHEIMVSRDFNKEH